MDTIEGYVEHIVYRNEENGYTVFSILEDGEEITCVGTLQFLSEGEYLKIEGEYVEHPTYGLQLKISNYEEIAPKDIASIALSEEKASAADSFFAMSYTASQ